MMGDVIDNRQKQWQAQDNQKRQSKPPAALPKGKEIIPQRVRDRASASSNDGVQRSKSRDEVLTPLIVIISKFEIVKEKMAQEKMQLEAARQASLRAYEEEQARMEHQFNQLNMSSSFKYVLEIEL
eukprot:UN02183